jgi:hypothetical protein
MVVQLLIHPHMSTHAISSVTPPTFLRHPVKNSRMIYAPSAVMESAVFFEVNLRGLEISKRPDRSVRMMTTDQYGTTQPESTVSGSKMDQ